MFYLNIIFDIDDTITDETGFVLKYAPKYIKKKYKINPTIKNPNGYNVSEIFGLQESFQSNTKLSDVEIEEECKRAIDGFWNSHFVKYMFYPLKKGVRKTVNLLKKENNNIYFLSSRGKRTKEMDTLFNEFVRLKVVPFLTKMQLKLNFIRYNQLEIVQDEEDKLNFINKIKPAVVIDDQLSLLERVPEFTQSVCIRTSHNIDRRSSDRIIRVSSFEHNELQEIISNISEKRVHKKYNHIKFFERLFTEMVYVLVRTIGRKHFIHKFNPLVRGMENIPKDKRAVIFAGNHRNNFDPLIATLFIDKPTHWAALLRLFQAKENLFGRNDRYILRKLSAMLIKAMGSIPIARETDDNYQQINLKSLLKIDEYIKLGSSIGFFPEGTLNRKPQERNLLPLKSNAIFQVAKRNNAWLQPFAIAWSPEDIETRHKVVLVFATPIETTGMKTDEIRKQWEESLNYNIDQINELFDELKRV